MKLTQIALIASLSMDLTQAAGTIADNAACDETIGLTVSCLTDTYCCGRLKPTTVEGTQ